MVILVEDKVTEISKRCRIRINPLYEMVAIGIRGMHWPKRFVEREIDDFKGSAVMSKEAELLTPKDVEYYKDQADLIADFIERSREDDARGIMKENLENLIRSLMHKTAECENEIWIESIRKWEEGRKRE